ncbi:MAG: hypothetical protein ACOWWM_18485 [Desulfobacterales bacterium]
MPSLGGSGSYGGDDPTGGASGGGKPGGGGFGGGASTGDAALDAAIDAALNAAFSGLPGFGYRTDVNPRDVLSFNPVTPPNVQQVFKDIISLRKTNPFNVPSYDALKTLQGMVKAAVPAENWGFLDKHSIPIAKTAQGLFSGLANMFAPTQAVGFGLDKFGSYVARESVLESLGKKALGTAQYRSLAGTPTTVATPRSGGGMNQWLNDLIMTSSRRRSRKAGEATALLRSMGIRV